MIMYPQQYPGETPPPPPYATPNNVNASKEHNDERMRKFHYLVNRYEINRDFATRLRGLEGYEITFIVDDSGSMNTPIGGIAGPYEHNPTRWDELRQIVSIVVDIASIFDPNGIDLYFLNRGPMRQVTDATCLVPVFDVPPSGPTPITRTLRQVLQEKRLEVQERKLLILIATDGVPTDDHGRQDIKTFEHTLRHERNPINRIPVTIIACTDDYDCIGYLNDWDKRIPNIDVADDYRSERAEIQKVQGIRFPFSFGDYVVKVLMGAVDGWFDILDERRVNTNFPPDQHIPRKKHHKDSCSIA